ncbi:MAG: hypothetical protein K2Q18_16340 [Bdellovibrionales bacterium]|nr:hypothetical protein [Bdellovibrionales bacterium]
MKTLLILGTILLGANAFAGNEKGNGGSGTESKIVAHQAHLESVSLKIKNFFAKNEKTLATQFPEFNIRTLVGKIGKSQIKVIDAEELLDKDGVSRTCLNFRDSALIECKSSGVESLINSPSALFVLVLHEYLGLIDAEETSPKNPLMIDGYSISKKIAPYVTKVSDYDLVISNKGNLQSGALTIEDKNTFSEITIEGAAALQLWNKMYMTNAETVTVSKNYAFTAKRGENIICIKDAPNHPEVYCKISISIEGKAI